MQEASGTSGPQPRTIAAPQTGVASLHLIWSRLSGLKKRRKGVALGLWGEAGIGKTHTALELLRGLSCRSLSLLASTPLTDLAGRLPRPPRLSAWAARMMDRAGAGEQTGSIDLLNAVTTTLGELAPFVLHLEDLHDAGTEQAELIGLLARTIQLPASACWSPAAFSFQRALNHAVTRPSTHWVRPGCWRRRLGPLCLRRR